MTTQRVAAANGAAMPTMRKMLPRLAIPAMVAGLAKSRLLATSVALAGLVVLGLAACGGGADDSPTRTYQSVALPMDLTLDQLTEEQQATFCSWINDPANKAASDPTLTGTPIAVVNACLDAFATYPLCTVGQYDACAKASFGIPDGATPDACTAIASCPVIPPVQFDIAPPSRVCDGNMMPGSLRWCDVDGTAKDMTTGLHWLKDANCSESLGFYQNWVAIAGVSDLFIHGYVMNYFAACDWAATLSTGHCGLLDGSWAGTDLGGSPWHLPTMDQFLTLRSGGEAVTPETPRLFASIFAHRGAPDFWTSTPSVNNFWFVASLFPDWVRQGLGGIFNEWYRRLPVRGTLQVTSVSSIASGKGYSIAPASALNPIAGSANYTRSYLTVPVWLPAPVKVALSSWDNAERTPRVFYFDTDPANPELFRIWYPHGSAVRFYLQVEGNSIHPGASVVGWPDAGGDNRLWKPEFVAGGAMLKSKLSGLCMHIETNDGLFLRQDPCDASNPGQVFVLTPRQGG